MLHSYFPLVVLRLTPLLPPERSDCFGEVVGVAELVVGVAPRTSRSLGWLRDRVGVLRVRSAMSPDVLLPLMGVAGVAAGVAVAAPFEFGFVAYCFSNVPFSSLGIAITQCAMKCS